MYVLGYSFSDIQKKITTVSVFSSSSSDIQRTKKIQEPSEEDSSSFSFSERMKRGASYQKDHFFALAEGEFIQAARLDPKKWEPYFELGMIALEKRNYIKSLLHFEKVLSMSKGNARAIAGMMKSLMAMDRLQEIEALLIQASQPYSSGIQLQRGIYLGLIGDPNGAQEALKLAQDGDIEIANNAKKILDAYREHSIFQDGIELHRQALLSKAFVNIGAFDLAIIQLKKILIKQQDYRDAWLILGYVYMQIEEYPFAVQAFQKAYALDSTKPETQYFLGLSTLKMGKSKESIHFFERALQNGYEPQIQVQQQLAEALVQTGQIKKAVKVYEEILLSSQQDIGSFVRPIWMYIEKLDDAKNAQILAEKAIDYYPKDPMALNLLGWTQWANGDFSKAKRNLVDSIREDQNFAPAYLNLGRVLESELKKEQALQYYQKAYELDAHGTVGNTAAQLYNELLLQMEDEE